MRRALLLFVTCLIIGGCTFRHLTPVCPSIVSYSSEDQKALATELMQPGERPQTIRWIGDYIGLRDQIRTCEKTENNSAN